MRTIADVISERIDALSATMTQKEIALAIGYTKANNVSMQKRGESKVPIEKVLLYAKVLGLDPADLFRLYLDQYLTSAEVRKLVTDLVITDDERRVLLEMRAAAA